MFFLVKNVVIWAKKKKVNWKKVELSWTWIKLDNKKFPIYFIMWSIDTFTATKNALIQCSLEQNLQSEQCIQ